MKTFQLYESDYFDGRNWHKDAAISLLTSDNHLIQIDTGCPYTFIHYDYALKRGIITEDYIHNTKNFSENELGQKFYFIRDFEVQCEAHSFIIEKCYLEFNSTKEYKKQQKVYWKNALEAENIGYLGLDVFLKYLAVFDFRENKLQLIDNLNLKEDSVSFELENNYCLLDIQLNQDSYKVMFDTGSSASGLILHQNFKERYLSIHLTAQEIIRNDFVAFLEFGYLDATIAFGSNEKHYKNVKVEFPNVSFNSYLFHHDTHDAILGLQFLKNSKITFDFPNKRFRVE